MLCRRVLGVGRGVRWPGGALRPWWQQGVLLGSGAGGARRWSPRGSAARRPEWGRPPQAGRGPRGPGAEHIEEKAVVGGWGKKQEGGGGWREGRGRSRGRRLLPGDGEYGEILKVRYSGLCMPYMFVACMRILD